MDRGTRTGCVPFFLAYTSFTHAWFHLDFNLSMVLEHGEIANVRGRLIYLILLFNETLFEVTWAETKDLLQPGRILARPLRVNESLNGISHPPGLHLPTSRRLQRPRPLLPPGLPGHFHHFAFHAARRAVKLHYVVVDKVCVLHTLLKGAVEAQDVTAVFHLYAAGVVSGWVGGSVLGARRVGATAGGERAGCVCAVLCWVRGEVKGVGVGDEAFQVGGVVVACCGDHSC